MPTIKVEKKSNYTVVDNTYLKDRRLSLRTIGLMTKIMSLPPNWDYSVAGLVSIVRDGESSVRAGLEELEINGYLLKDRERRNDGTLAGTLYTIYEVPPKRDFPVVDFPVVEKPVVEKRGQLNTDQSSTDTNKYGNKTEYAPGVFLTEAEHEKLVAKMGTEAASGCLNLLSRYKSRNGKKYKNDYKAIERWVIRAYYDDQSKKATKPRQMTAAEEAIAALESMEA